MQGKGIAPIPHTAAEFTFQQHEVITGCCDNTQTVLTGFFLGGAIAEVAVVNVDENNNGSLGIYAFGNDTWVPKLEVPLPPEVLFVDVANIGGRDRLITYQRGHLNWFNPESATEYMLVEVTTNYKAMEEGKIPHIDITRDINHDGLDDLLVPNVDGFWVATQLSNGSFTAPIKTWTT